MTVPIPHSIVLQRGSTICVCGERADHPVHLPDDEATVTPFGTAKVGDLVHTWENADGGDWGAGGDYTFETVDPFETYDRYHLADIGPITRKLWRLVDITEITVTPTDDDDEQS